MEKIEPFTQSSPTDILFYLYSFIHPSTTEPVFCRPPGAETVDAVFILINDVISTAASAVNDVINDFIIKHDGSKDGGRRLGGGKPKTSRRPRKCFSGAPRWRDPPRESEVHSAVCHHWLGTRPGWNQISYTTTACYTGNQRNGRGSASF